MKIGFISFDHLLDWTGITRLIDQIAAEMTVRGHSVTIIAREGSASVKTPVSMRKYPHELLALKLDSYSDRIAARDRIAHSGLDICVASVGSKDLIYLPCLFYSTGIPFVHGEAADPRVFIYERWQPYEHFGSLYPASAFTVLLEQYLPFYPEALKKKAHVIGNPAPPSVEIDFKERCDKKIHTIIAVGRFNEEDKRFSMLLRAFSFLYDDFSDWNVKLVGDGPYLEYYEIMAAQLGIRKRVIFTGAVSDPGVFYKDADIFCITSFRAEGLPMVMLEASAYALPMAGYRSCAASEALITPETGVLADSVNGNNTPEALAGALRLLMELSPEERERIGINSRESLQKKYGNGIVFDQWESLLKGVLERKVIMKNQDIGTEWGGLEPDNPVWTSELLAGAADEIAKREDPLSARETADAPVNESMTENVRLRCELAQARRDYGMLMNKYTALLGQFQTLANKKPTQKRKKP